MYLAGSIDVKLNSPELKMMIWNINMYYKKDPFLFLRKKMASKIAMMGITTQCFDIPGIKCATGDPLSLPDVVVNVPELNKFINELTRDSRRALPKPYVSLADGVSNIFITRVSVGGGTTACFFTR
jgi:hypothetical protein